MVQDIILNQVRCTKDKYSYNMGFLVFHLMAFTGITYYIYSVITTRAKYPVVAIVLIVLFGYESSLFCVLSEELSNEDESEQIC